MKADNSETQTVVVQVTLAVQIKESWGDDCTLGQLRKQAAEAAHMRIERLFQGADAVVPMTIAEKKTVSLRRVDLSSILWERS